MLRGRTPPEPEFRERLVKYLRAVAAAIAAALVGFVLQVMLGALGVSDVLGEATVHGAEAVRGMADQLREVLPRLVTPTLVAGQFAASIVLLNEASELLEASPWGPWTLGDIPAPTLSYRERLDKAAPSASERRSRRSTRDRTPAPIKDPEILKKIIALSKGAVVRKGPSGSDARKPQRGPGGAPGAP